MYKEHPYAGIFWPFGLGSVKSSDPLKIYVDIRILIYVALGYGFPGKK